MMRANKLLGLAVVLLATSAHAGIPESIDLVTTELPGSCASALPAAPNLPFFDVNALPIPSMLYSQDPNNSPPLWSLIASPFDSTFLHEGSNTIDFSVSTTNGADYCTVSRHEATLYDSRGQKRPLFNVYRNGMAYMGAVTINLRLADIDPILADDLGKFRDSVADYETKLIDHAADADQLAKQLSEIDDLQIKVDALLANGFDAIDQAALDALMAQYADVSAELKGTLDQLLTDLRKTVQDFRDEIAQLEATYRMQAQAVTDAVVTGPARDNGFNPSDPSGYTVTVDPSQVPDVPVPQIGTDPFDPNHDPYAAYADAIIAQLNATISMGSVQDRAMFQSIVAGWRRNQDVVQHAIDLRAGASQAEIGAFLSAQSRVLSLVRTYMDANDWFMDAPIPAALKLLVDGVLLIRMANQAKRVKEGLNEWYGPQPTPQQQIIIDTLLAIGDSASDWDAATADDPSVPWTMQRVLDGAVVVIKEVAKVAVYVSPVGPFISLCEVVSGHELCLPSGRTLSRGERVFSAATVVIGAGFWRAFGKAFSGIGKLACADAAEVERVYKAVKGGASGFTSIGTNIYRSPAGLIYGLDEELESRVVHVLLHGYPNTYKTTQSVFKGAVDDIVKVIDEGWAKRGLPSPKDPGRYVIWMGDNNRTIGTAGEQWLRVIVKPGTSEIISAYPVLSPL